MGTMIWSIDYDSEDLSVPALPSGDSDTCGTCKEDPGFDPSNNPFELSEIDKLAAIGDSYSAGIGAGDRLGSVVDVLTDGSGMLLTSILPQIIIYRMLQANLTCCQTMHAAVTTKHTRTWSIWTSDSVKEVAAHSSSCLAQGLCSTMCLLSRFQSSIAIKMLFLCPLVSPSKIVQ
jgi:hypothetical protein